MNSYLAKLAALTKPSSVSFVSDRGGCFFENDIPAHGSVSFVSDQRLRFLKNENSKNAPLTNCQNCQNLPAYPPAPYGRVVLTVLESRCPECIEAARWQQAVEDGKHFLAQWGEQAHALGWTARDLFSLHSTPDKPAPSYRRLSRYDEAGLIWLLRGRRVVALTASTAAIENPTGAVTIYRRHIQAALGRAGDCLNDLEPDQNLAR
jgi:hypothetical protein